MDIPCKNTGNELSTDEIIECINQFADLGIYQIGISGGEPFMRSDILEILEYASNKNIKIAITTNGFFLDDKNIRKLKKIENISLIQVSLDGSNEETHDYIRQYKGAYKSAINAISGLVSEGITTGVVTTVMKLNIDQVPDITKKVKQLGVSIYGARRFMPVGKGNKLRDSLLISKEDYARHLQYWSDKKINDSDLEYIIEEPLLSIFESEKHSNSGCPAGNSYGAITSLGDIRACIFIPLSLGNIRNKKFSQIWETSDIRNKIIGRAFEGKCSICNIKENCSGCRAAAYAINNDLMGEDPFCFYDNPLVNKK